MYKVNSFIADTIGLQFSVHNGKSHNCGVWEKASWS